MIRREEEEIINQTINGKVYRCTTCNKIHVDYKNLSFTFNKPEYQNFSQYMKKLDGEYWAQKNEEHSGNRKIMIPINHQNLILNFSMAEIVELKDLLASQINAGSNFKWITTHCMNFQISDN